MRGYGFAKPGFLVRDRHRKYADEFDVFRKPDV
jgi:hypothetical protein